jgi:hypothetical protein
MSTPATPETGYTLASEGTPTRPPINMGNMRNDSDIDLDLPETFSRSLYMQHDEADDLELHHEEEELAEEQEHDHGQPSETSSRSYGSYNEESMLEMLDEDELEGDDLEEDDAEAGQPLVSRGKRRRKWEEGEDGKERSLIEVRTGIGWG